MPGEVTHRFAVTVSAVPESLERLHALVEQVGAERPDVSAVDLSMVETAVIELAANVAEHGYPPGVKMTLEIEVADDVIRAELRDGGDDPRVDVDSAILPEEFAEAGRGLFMARAVVDEIRFERRTDHNLWVVVRRRT